MTIPGHGGSRDGARLARVAPGGVEADAGETLGLCARRRHFTQMAVQVSLATDAKKPMKIAGRRPPEGEYRKVKVMGREFDPAKPEESVKRFAVHELG
jgi:hypothetical protein